MNGELWRVQVYLDSEDVSVIEVRTAAVTTNPLKELIGAKKSRTGEVGLDIDSVYTHAEA